ncbi:hypothetical protein [Methylobacter sp. S3L5C]|uniref:hypothetical protein n=1 Tax=Methylobacter sp. S3L5C TaxID=2839024 RepID=UPI001FAC56AC|nr:hypothetical protein [Methylobacter sp. S3L5C]UOA07635.1 hypothetical protein KKZ03_15395 [Methylobacter sp. S3L5C]
MTVAVDIWQLLGVAGALLGTLVSVIITAGKLLVGQFEARLDEKFSTQEEARSSAQRHWDVKFAALELAAANEAREWQRVERDIMQMKADLPIHYVRRDDYIRNQSVIEAKIDGLAVRLENAFLKGDRYG